MGVRANAIFASGHADSRDYSGERGGICGASLAGNPAQASAPKRPRTGDAPTAPASKVPDDGNLWVDRYKPWKLTQLVGNADGVARLQQYLAGWNPGGMGRAVCLVGPPGTGKTTAAILVTRACGFAPIEFNASSLRSGTALRQVIGHAGDASTLDTFAEKKTAKPQAIIMDEVDGMYNRKDVGGTRVLIEMIKTSRIPFICIANDAYCEPMKVLKPHVDLIKWFPPSPEEMRPRLQAICQAERAPVDAAALLQYCAASRGDMRSVINKLQHVSLTRDKPLSAVAANKVPRH